MLRTLVRTYLKHSPIERGKWRLWEFASPILREEHRVECFRTKLGFRMELHRSEFIDNFIFNWGCWEPDETWLMSQLLRAGDAFVDVGANVGYFTLAGSCLVGNTGHVYAFEPVPSTAARLETNLKLNAVTNVTLNPLACTDKPGLVTLSSVSPRNPGAQTMRNIDACSRSWSVQGIRLDEQLPPDRSYALVKMDIEGAEALALSGLSGHFEKRLVNAVLCEITEEFLVALGSSTERVFEMMSGYGFAAFQCKNSQLRKVTPKEAAKTQTNVLFRL